MSSSHILSIGIFSCLTVPKYRDQVLACRETWGKVAEKEGVPVIYFAGAVAGPLLDDPHIIDNPELGDHYESAFTKQFKMMTYLTDNFDTDWYLIAGSDTYPVIGKMIEYVKGLNAEEPVMVGVTCGDRNVGGLRINYLSGAGILISKAAMKLLYPFNEWIVKEWPLIPQLPTPYLGACDMALAYTVRIHSIPIQTIYSPGFCGCNDLGMANGTHCCHIRNRRDRLLYHYMEPERMKAFYEEIELGRDEIYREYERVRTQWSDIYEHIPTLYEYTKRCSSVVECGVRTCVSTYAFIKGLRDNGSPDKRLTSVDLEYSPSASKVSKMCKAADIQFTFVVGDDLVFECPQTDLLFIDTFHVYAHLRRELAKLHSKANKYIILHDTTVDGDLGECVRNKWNAKHLSQEYGYPIQEIVRGLTAAVHEFLAQHPDWVVDKVYTGCNGLTILKRIDNQA